MRLRCQHTTEEINLVNRPCYCPHLKCLLLVFLLLVLYRQQFQCSSYWKMHFITVIHHWIYEFVVLNMSFVSFSYRKRWQRRYATKVKPHGQRSLHYDVIWAPWEFIGFKTTQQHSKQRTISNKVLWVVFLGRTGKVRYQTTLLQTVVLRLHRGFYLE